jgi:hypothetical protein
MAPSKGNKNALKLTCDELKVEAYKQYCEWIASGESKETFTFRHPSLSLSYKTMEKYIREDPIVFPPIQKEMAEAESRRVWEKDGKSMMLGGIKGCQPVIYQMFMRNKFGWDKESKITVSRENELDKFIDHINKVELIELKE